LRQAGLLAEEKEAQEQEPQEAIIENTETPEDQPTSDDKDQQLSDEVIEDAGMTSDKEHGPEPDVITKDNPVSPAQDEPVKKVPVNISRNSIKGGRPKKA